MREGRSLLEVTPGKVLRRFGAEESEQLCREWELAFPANREGIHAEQFMWHVFSSGRYPSVRRAAALAEYEKQVAPKYLVLTNDRDEAVITDQRPSNASVTDYLVCPLAWTMAFTHEDEDLGPYFAVHRDYDRLQKANVKGMLKVREAEIAKQRGWA